MSAVLLKEYTKSNLLNDATSLRFSVEKLLTAKDQDKRDEALSDILLTGGKILAGGMELAKTWPTLGGLLGQSANVAQVQLALDRVEKAYYAGGISAVKVSDTLAYLGGMNRPGFSRHSRAG